MNKYKKRILSKILLYGYLTLKNGFPNQANGIGKIYFDLYKLYYELLKSNQTEEF